MTFSMTGYGKQSGQFHGRLITIEIRTLNSKQTDINVRMPSIYREKEFEIRDALAKGLVRGKIDINIQRSLSEEESGNELNMGVFKTHFERLRTIEAEMGLASSESAIDYLSIISRMPDAIKPLSEELEDGEYEVLTACLTDAIASVNEFRLQEGKKLEAVLLSGKENIESLLSSIGAYEKERIDRIRGKLNNGVSDEQKESSNFDNDRFEQELIYYIEKLDITEEKVRLKAHCEYFEKTMHEEKFKGKKLGFIAQEMGREINTLGSKSQHSEMQRAVVGMKDELEKIKEQLLNVL